VKRPGRLYRPGRSAYSRPIPADSCRGSSLSRLPTRMSRRKTYTAESLGFRVTQGGRPADVRPRAATVYDPVSPMDAALEKLIALQRAEGEVRRVEAALQEVPKAKAELDAALAAERGRLDAAKAALADTQKNRKTHEGALQDLEAKRSKYKGQLMDVKTNKE